MEAKRPRANMHMYERAIVGAVVRRCSIDRKQWRRIVRQRSCGAAMHLSGRAACSRVMLGRA